MIDLKQPIYFKDYQLIDSGNFEKLEKFGDFVVSRPEPQAIWDKSLPDKEWQKLAHAQFQLKKTNNQVNNFERGEWKLKQGTPQSWYVTYHYKDMCLKFRLALTSFKHVGIFPEQAENWNFIYDTIKEMKSTDVRVLNLFAYTGGASLAARAAGADVTHLDAVKQVVNWAKDNMIASSFDNIRWIVDDAMKFVRREVKRGKMYTGIILDPPAYGRGPDGEKWILEEALNELLKYCKLLLNSRSSFLVLNLYSMGYSPLIAENLLNTIFQPQFIEAGELIVIDQAQRRLPLGVYARLKN